MRKPTIYALYVGINEYVNSKKNLNCCENDVKAIDKYVSDNLSTEFRYNPLFLLNKEATRDNIIGAFYSHLIENASEQDIVLFYFSGHGGREEAPDFFKVEERDGLLEGIVCHDSTNYGSRRIADKELRYLFGLLSEKGSQIISIFDCCHSGDIVRFDEGDITVREVPDINQAREIEEFVFSEDETIKMEILAGQKSLDEILPKGRFVQLAACQDTEYAGESRRHGHGLFTYFLLKKLKESKGIVSYYDLVRKISLELQNIPIVGFSQNPDVYAPPGHRELVFRRFLFGQIENHFLKANAYFDSLKKKWVINLGAFHGVKKGITNTDQNGIYEDSVWIDLGVGQLVKPNFNRVFANYSEISFEESKEISLDKNQIFEAFFPSVFQQAIYLTLTGNDKNPNNQDFVRYYKSEQEDLKSKGVYLAREKGEGIPSEALVFRVEVDAEKISLKEINSNLKVIPDVSLSEVRAHHRFFQNITQIGKWNFLKNMSGSGFLTLGSGVELTINLSNQDKSYIHPETQAQIFEHKPYQDSEPIEVQFEFKNHTRQDVYFSCIYLDSEFGIHSKFMVKPVELLSENGPQSTINIPLKGTIKMRLPSFLRKENYARERVFFKVFLSTSPFDTSLFYAPSIRTENEMEMRGFDFDEEEVEDWKIQTFAFELINPDHK